MNPRSLAGDGAVLRLRRDDFAYPHHAGLLRGFPQQRHRHVCLDIVRAHIARRAAVGFQKRNHRVHIPGQINGHGYRLAFTDRRLPGSPLSRGAALLHTGGQGVEPGAQLGVGELRRGRRSRQVLSPGSARRRAQGQRDCNNEESKSLCDGHDGGFGSAPPGNHRGCPYKTHPRVLGARASSPPAARMAALPGEEQANPQPPAPNP